MKKLLGLALGALLAWSTAADAAPIEFKTVTTCGGTAYTVGSSGQATGLPTGEICNSLGNSSGSPLPVVDAALAAILGQVQASPTANTTNDRLKTINTSIQAATVPLGQAARSASVPVTIADINSGEYENVAASQTAQVLGATGATGDYLMQVECAPTTTSPGVVTILDNATGWTGGSFAGGASSVSNLIPFTIVVNAYSISGAWAITTGANISCTATGNFT